MKKLSDTDIFGIVLIIAAVVLILSMHYTLGWVDNSHLEKRGNDWYLVPNKEK